MGSPTQRADLDTIPPDVQAGASMVEVVLAIFALAVMALGLAPLLIGSAQAGTTNTQLVTANSFANAQLSALREKFPNDPTSVTAWTCADVQARAAVLTAATAPSGLASTVSLTGSCPAVWGAVGVRVVVTSTATGTTLATLTTKVLIPS
jgi:Tfp pilus assembly protein PilV